MAAKRLRSAGASPSAPGLASAPKPRGSRLGVMAAGVAATIALGATMGALLRQDKQKTEAVEGFREIDPAQQIAMLEGHRKTLQSQLDGMQRKVDVFKQTREERKAQEERR